MSSTLQPLPYVRDSSEIGVDRATQKEINWMSDGTPLYGNTVQSEPNFGSLNKVGTNLQENIVTCNQNIHTVYNIVSDLTTQLADAEDLLQRTTPPKIISDLPKYVILHEGGEIEEAVVPFHVKNFDTIIWKHNGEIIQLPSVTELNLGAVLSVLSEDGTVTSEIEGEYQAIVYNEGGSAISNTLFINLSRKLYDGAPIITEDLDGISTTISEFEKLELKVLAENFVSIQWKRDGYPIDGATTNVLNILHISGSQSGVYSCDIVNPNGVTTSTLKNISVSSTIHIPPTVSVHPTNKTVTEEDDAVFIVSGQNYEYIHWEKDGEIINDVSSSVLQIFSVTEEDEGWYRAKFSNGAGVTYSQYVYLTIIPLTATLPPEMILQPPTILNVSSGDAFTIEVASKHGTCSVWQKNGTAILNDSNVLTIESASLEDTGTYRYLAFNANGYVESTSCNIIIDSDEIQLNASQFNIPPNKYNMFGDNVFSYLTSLSDSLFDITRNINYWIDVKLVLNSHINSSGTDTYYNTLNIGINDRVLLLNQNNPVENGIYYRLNNTLVRVPDANNTKQFTPDKLVKSKLSDENGNQYHRFSMSDGFVLNSSAIIFLSSGTVSTYTTNTSNTNNVLCFDINEYEYTIETNSYNEEYATKIINHNLNRHIAKPDFMDEDGFYLDIIVKHIDMNNVRIQIGEPITGKLIIT